MMPDKKIAADIRKWLAKQLASSPRGTRSRLAEAIGVDRSAITSILNGTRNITASEMVIIRGFFGLAEPGELRPVQGVQGVRVVGRLGENIWMRIESADSADDKAEIVPASDLTYPIETQTAYIVVEKTAGGEYLQNDRIYAVPFSLHRGEPLIDDIVVVRTEVNGFVRFTLRHAVLSSNGGVALAPMALEADLAVAENETIIALVIGFFRPQSRR